MKIEKNDPANFNKHKKIKRQINQHMEARSTTDLLNSINSMSLRMGTELTDTDYRFNEYRRLNAFSDINYKLEIDMRKLIESKKLLMKNLESTQLKCRLQSKINHDDHVKMKKGYAELDKLITDFDAIQKDAKDEKIYNWIRK